MLSICKNLAREADCKSCKVSLQSWVDGETSGSRVHAGDVLTIVNVLQDQLVPIVPI